MRYILIVFCLLCVTMLVVAQEDEQPAPQFLYRDGNSLILVDGYTGESTELPIEVGENDQFEWSPDGKYLVAQLYGEEWSDGYCINLYDVDFLSWVYDEPIACDVWNMLFASDGSQIIYSTSDWVNGILWVYDIAGDISKELYRTTDGQRNYSAGIEDVAWSPTKKYLMFVHYVWDSFGALNVLVIMNIETGRYFIVQGGSQHYATYNPIWSQDDSWFLIQLKYVYILASRTQYLPFLGDVYLFESESGEQHRLTYTPAVLERDIHWTEDGNVAFTVVTEEDFEFTIDEAMDVEVIPDDEIIMPEILHDEAYQFSPLHRVTFSPDPNIGFWISSTDTQEGERVYELHIGTIQPMSVVLEPDFIILLPDDYEHDKNIIGWRPSDYPYSSG